MVNHVYTRLRSRIRRRWRSWSRQQISPFNSYAIVAIVILFIWFILHGKSKHVHEPRHISLHGQPNYSPPTHRACQAKLCNPSGVCSLWAPGVYQWKELADQSIYRDVASVEVGFGCQAVLRVEQATEQIELITVANERLTCNDNLAGLDTICGNVIQITVECNVFVCGCFR
jgi:hypothetical protein